MRRIMLVSLSVLFASILTFSADSGPLLLQSPTLSKTQIAFAFGGDIWTVNRAGGDAQRLVTGTGLLGDPHFSPDGLMVAYTGDYEGNLDVYVVAATGGEPRRLTFHPGPDWAVGWTPDGKSVLFGSHRLSYSDPNQLFTVPVEGGFPTALPLPMAESGAYSPDGSHFAYSPYFQWEPEWKGYRGGQTTPIWIADLRNSSIVKIPRDNSNDRSPLWIGDKVYFLSDRNGPVTLFEYDPKSQQVKQLITNQGFDIKHASAGPGAIVYEQFGAIFLYDLHSGKTKRVSITVNADMPQVRPHFEKVEKQIQNAQISPTGARAVFEAHGDIFTVPAEKGDVRNITKSPIVADRDPAWSPDGKSLAYFSDESGEYALHISAQTGLGPVTKIDLGKPPSFFYSPTWSPDSKKITYSDKRMNVWYVDLEKKTPVLVDTDLFEGPTFNTVWSPDSKWLAYCKQLDNHMHAVFVYSLETGKATQITDGMSDALFPDFDKNGKYLYFTASTDIGLVAAGDMSAINRPVTRSVYAVVLKKGVASPLAPESDEEKPPEEKKKEGAEATKEASGDKATADKSKESAEAKDKEKPKEPPKVEIDFDRISQRILAMPIPSKNYFGLAAGKEGEVYLVEGPPTIPFDGPPVLAASKFTFKERKTDKLVEGIAAFAVSFNGEKMLYQQGKTWFINPTEKAPEAGKGNLKTADMEVDVNPRAEWKQIYHEVWRIERDFFCDPHYHGLDLQQAEKTFAPFLDNITSRSDLTYLFHEMLSYMSVGHMFVGGGTQPDIPKIKVGLLGADYKIENGRYRFARVYDGENWNPKLQAPLTQPGVDVKEGEYLLAVNGREVRGTDDVYSYFLETAGQQTVLKVGPNADGSSSREVTVVPVDNESGLRNLAWVESNRRKVDQMTGGKVAYIYLPDTFVEGYTNFNRYFFAQVGKDAAIVDERFNHGGFLADFIVDYLRRPILNKIMTREGKDSSSPAGAIYGPKVMIVNQFAGSGGDALPWYFRKLAIGPIVGERTWGGLIGIGGYPPLLDNGYVMAPREAIYGLKGDWEVENHGIAPDIEVMMDPKLVREGHDPQLEKAVETVMQMLKDHPMPEYARPKYPDFHPALPPLP
ncbi:MAG TPA: PDZ domain-containing protein [Terriglobia bacterium]|nr:PDZ domain-containing protein [Terriglobia bacterium]